MFCKCIVNPFLTHTVTQPTTYLTNRIPNHPPILLTHPSYLNTLWTQSSLWRKLQPQYFIHLTTQPLILLHTSNPPMHLTHSLHPTTFSPNHLLNIYAFSIQLWYYFPDIINIKECTYPPTHHNLGSCIEGGIIKNVIKLFTQKSFETFEINWCIHYTQSACHP